jgi:transglutaminase-like putative cysteine protease
VDLKQSGKILFRVRPETAIIRPMLIREACYDRYRFSNWFSDELFYVISSEHDEKTWKLHADPVRKTKTDEEKQQSVSVSCYLKKGKGMLKLPGGTYQIDNLPVIRTDVNPLGAVRVEGGPGFVSYTARYDSEAFTDKPPDVSDLLTPKEEWFTCRKIVDDLRISSADPEQALQVLEDYFNDHFRYSLSLISGSVAASPLSDFLLRTRAGHCEYFATAAVLLLRTAGIPARYAAGYAVHEFSSLEGQYLVRNRDAHAWTLAYVNGAWRDADMTPSSWMQIEAKQGLSWEAVSDVWQWLTFTASRWRMSSSKRPVLLLTALFLIPYIVYRVRNIRAKKRIRRSSAASAPIVSKKKIPGTDSSFFQIESRLSEMGLPRYPWESLSAWIRRIEHQVPASSDISELKRLKEMHYRRRFDPDGIGADEEKKMRTDAQAFIRYLSVRNDP